MTFFYISDDLEDDIRRCIQSWERQDPIVITGVSIEGQIKEFSGTVQTIHREPGRAEGKLWWVLIRRPRPLGEAPVQRTLSASGSTLAV
jgi:hypothetical protein